MTVESGDVSGAICPHRFLAVAHPLEPTGDFLLVGCDGQRQLPMQTANPLNLRALPAPLESGKWTDLAGEFGCLFAEWKHPVYITARGELELIGEQRFEFVERLSVVGHDHAAPCDRASASSRRTSASRSTASVFWGSRAITVLRDSLASSSFPSLA